MSLAACRTLHAFFWLGLGVTATVTTERPPLRPVNISTADSEQLQQVPRIGPATAQKLFADAQIVQPAPATPWLVFQLGHWGRSTGQWQSVLLRCGGPGCERWDSEGSTGSFRVPQNVRTIVRIDATDCWIKRRRSWLAATCLGKARASIRR